MGFAQFADVHTTVLDAGEEVVTEGDHVGVLAGGIGVEDSDVLVVAVQFEHGQASIHELLVAELRTNDIDLGVSACLTAQGATSRLRHDQVLAAALGVHSVDGFVEGAEAQSLTSGGAVLEVLAVELVEETVLELELVVDAVLELELLVDAVLELEVVVLLVVVLVPPNSTSPG